jgi:hypothetical protein
MTDNDLQATVSFLRDHVGHDMKFLAFATAKFGSPEAQCYQVPLHDSALVRARALIDFFRSGPTNRCLREKLFYKPGVIAPALDNLVGAWFEFISGRLSHLGRNRDADFDQWPDRDPGQEKGDDRLERLAHFLIALMRARATLLCDDARAVLEMIAQRAEHYLDDPTEANFHAMDPANLMTA